MSSNKHKTGLVSRIIPFSCVDGPGNRFVVFLQGCNFNCKNCHNPQTITRCQHCGDCVATCPSGALSFMDGKISWNEPLCQSCDKCIDSCPNSSSPMVRDMQVEDVIIELIPAAPFLSGITVSGGESTIQIKFIRQLFKAVREHPDLSHLTCLIDSNGYLPVSTWESILPEIDGAMIDLKAMDTNLHKWLTDRDNKRVLDSIRLLNKHNKLTEIRFLAIPDMTDTPKELTAIKGFFKSLSTDMTLKVNAFSNKAVRGEACDWPNLPEGRAEDIHDFLTT